MKWNGRNYRPAGQYIKYKQSNKDFDFADALKPLGEKESKGNIWHPVLLNAVVMNVPETSSSIPPVSPTPTPTIPVSPTPTQTPSPTTTLTSTPTPSPTTTLTSTPTQTSTPTTTLTSTPTPSPTTTLTSTPTPSPTTTLTSTPTQTSTPTPTDIRLCRTYELITTDFPLFVSYTDCDGNPQTWSQPFGTTEYKCAKQGSMVITSGSGTITDIGSCPLPTPTPTQTSTPTTTLTSTPTPSPTTTLTSTPTQTPTTTTTLTSTPTPSPTTTLTSTPTQTSTPTTTLTSTPTQTSTPTTTLTSTPTKTPSPTSTPTPTATTPFNTNAATYLNAVLVAGGTLSPTISAATNTLFTSLTSAGLYNKLSVFYPMLGSTAASTALNGNRTSGTTYDLTYIGGLTISSSGATGNGLNGYADTQFSNQLFLQDNYSLGVYQFTNNAPAKTEELIMGERFVGQPPIFQFASSLNPTTIFLRSGNDTTASVSNGGNASGLYVINRTGSTTSSLYKNGNTTPLLTITGSYTNSPVGGSVYLWNFNNSGVPYTNGYANQGLSFIFFGSGLSNTEITDLSNIINTFSTTLGRNTYS